MSGGIGWRMRDVWLHVVPLYQRANAVLCFNRPAPASLPISKAPLVRPAAAPLLAAYSLPPSACCSVKDKNNWLQVLGVQLAASAIGCKQGYNWRHTNWNSRQVRGGPHKIAVLSLVFDVITCHRRSEGVCVCVCVLCVWHAFGFHCVVVF